MPNDAEHSDCKLLGYEWCPTAFKDAKNISKSCGVLPIGMGELFAEWFSELFDDEMITVLMNSGCTSYNESCNNIINKYAHKKRYLGWRSYEGAVARGICQWNNPYTHLKEELTVYHIHLTNEHKRELQRNIQQLQRITKWSRSHERYLKRHQKRHKKLDSWYVGGINGLISRSMEEK